MYTALVTAQVSTGSGISVTKLLVLIALFVIAWPLFRKLRGSVSENRKRRWVEEGLMDPPSVDPPSAGPGSAEGSE